MTSQRVKPPHGSIIYVRTIKVGDNVRVLFGPSEGLVGTVMAKQGFRLRINIGDIKTLSQVTAAVRRVD